MEAWGGYLCRGDAPLAAPRVRGLITAGSYQRARFVFNTLADALITLPWTPSTRC